MIYALKPVCKKDWKRKDETSLVFIQYCMDSNQRTLVDTQIAIPPEYWNRKLLKIYGDLPQVYGIAAELNERMQKMMRLAEDLLSFCIKNTRDNPMFFLKKNFSPDLDIATLEQRKEKTGSLDVYNSSIPILNRRDEGFRLQR